ncbi:MAG TPA: endonuclease/exonuclease/phosphatase family protein [Thermoanaerobaculia bacterium]
MARWKRILLVFGAIFAVVFGYRFFAVYEFRAGECKAAQPRVFASTYPKRLVVMSWNIQGHASLLRGEHIAKVAETIAQIKPDIVGINEAHRGTWQSRFDDHVEELRRRTGLNAAFGESYDLLGGEFGNAVLTRGRIVKADVHRLPGTGEPRTVMETIIDIDGGRVEFFVTHLTAWEKLNRATRRVQLACLANHVRASAHPFILTGDLNAPPDAPELVEFRGDTVLQMPAGLTPTHRVMNLQLDYVFADRGWTVASARVLDIGPSDHRPVVVELVHQ